MNEYLAVPGVNGLWAAGDCAAVPDVTTGTFCPPTAQHGLRQGVAAAKNIEAAIVGRPLKPFRYRAMGLLASIGRHTGVAMVFGVKFSGFAAWWLWRTVYLAKLPGLAKKLRVMVGWTLDLFFGREIEQMITVRDVGLLTIGSRDFAVNRERIDGGLSRPRPRAASPRRENTGSGVAPRNADDGARLALGSEAHPRAGQAGPLPRLRWRADRE